MFVHFEDRMKVIVDLASFERSNRLLKKEVLGFAGKYQKHLKNKPMVEHGKVGSAAPAKDSDFFQEKGHNCGCVIRGPLTNFVAAIETTFGYKGDLILNHMPMLKSGFCRKLTFQHFINVYIRVNNLVHPSSNQHKVMDDNLKECFEGTTPADKLYIKLPVDNKGKEVDLQKVKHAPMRKLFERIGRPMSGKKTHKHSVNVYGSIMNGECTKMEYLEALPHITDMCRKELLSYFAPPELKAKMRMSMDDALMTKMLNKPLNTVQLAQIAKPDFDSSCYTAFSGNCLTQPNLDTNYDLKRMHVPGKEDKASMEMGTLNDPSTMVQLVEELSYIRGVWMASSAALKQDPQVFARTKSKSNHGEPRVIETST